jgi:hypothetical protein
MMEVEAKTRKIRASWTIKMANDISYYSGIDMSDFEKVLKRELRIFTRKEKIKKIFR